MTKPLLWELETTLVCQLPHEAVGYSAEAVIVPRGAYYAWHIRDLHTHVITYDPGKSLESVNACMDAVYLYIEQEATPSTESS